MTTDETYKLLGLEPEKCPHCGAHLTLVGKPSYEGGTGKPICLNACHLGEAGQRWFQESISAFMARPGPHRRRDHDG